MNNKLVIAERLLLTVWMGSWWSIGYIAVPILFFTLPDPHVAGSVAVRMFYAVRVMGLVCGGLMLAGMLLGGGAHGWRRNWRIWTVLIMLFLTAATHFLLSPVMDHLRAGGLAAGTAAAARFDHLHHVASSLYTVTSLLGLALVIGGLWPRRGAVEVPA